MKVLLVNPNQFRTPPVPPIGLEHVAAGLEAGGHDVRLVDLCFSNDLIRDLDGAMDAFGPDAVGLTVRNVDTVLYPSNEFFLDDIRGLISHVKKNFGRRVFVGGTGVSTNPEGVREYLGADYAVAGPSEGAMEELVEAIRQGEEKRVITRRYRYDISCPRRRGLTDYSAYLESGGIGGFQTHKGCGSSCIYCIEANTPVSFRRVEEVVAEIKGFADAGITRFHLCDSEFNEDLDYSLDFLEALKRAGMKIEWAVYMKAANQNRKLFRLMKDCGVSLVTLTVDSWKKCPLYWGDIEKIIFSARSCGIRIVVDFLAGFPREDEDLLKWYLDLFRRLQPDSVGINTYIRLYSRLLITKIIMADQGLRERLLGATEDPQMIRPVFYNHVEAGRLRELIGGDPLFRIEGFDKGVNYTRAG